MPAAVGCRFQFATTRDEARFFNHSPDQPPSDPSIRRYDRSSERWAIILRCASSKPVPASSLPGMATRTLGVLSLLARKGRRRPFPARSVNGRPRPGPGVRQMFRHLPDRHGSQGDRRSRGPETDPSGRPQLPLPGSACPHTQKGQYRDPSRTAAVGQSLCKKGGPAPLITGFPATATVVFPQNRPGDALCA